MQEPDLTVKVYLQGKELLAELFDDQGRLCLRSRKDLPPKSQKYWQDQISLYFVKALDSLIRRTR